MWTHDLLPQSLAPARPGYRDFAAQLLRSAGRALDALATRLATVPTATAVAPPEPWLEFHAEAGAPEGALYVNGQLMGHLSGVRRL